MPNGGVKINQMTPTYGYPQHMTDNYIRLQITFKRKSYKVAVLVAAAFLGKRPDGLDVSHVDEDSFNNTPDNLVYETRRANLNRPAIKAYHSQVCRQKMESK